MRIDWSILDSISTHRFGVDPKKGDQTVRGTCELPHNNGKKSTILFVCTNENNKQVALENGADMVVDADILENVFESDCRSRTAK